MEKNTDLDELRALTGKLSKMESEKDLALKALREAYEEIQRTRIKFALKRHRGWIDVGGTRMFLVDLACWWQLRELIMDSCGELPTDELYFKAGNGEVFTPSALREGFITPTAEGFRAAVDCYSEAGFGNFIIDKLEYDKGYTVITCDDAFEGWGLRTQGITASKPVCEYSRGVLLSFMEKLTKIQGLECKELTCIATGDDLCKFVIAPKGKE